MHLLIILIGVYREAQLAREWSAQLQLAARPGCALEQVHIFCLAHVLRRPVIVYGVKYVKSWRGENLGYARFEGKKIPLILLLVVLRLPMMNVP